MRSNELPEPDHIPEPKMTNLHECVRAAAGSSTWNKPEPKSNFSVRLPNDLKAQAEFICERNAITLGAYLRECTKALVRDYGVEVPENQE